jgi:hypothetical protein
MISLMRNYNQAVGMFLYALLALVLYAGGIAVMDKPLIFFGILIIVGAIDLNSFTKGLTNE